MNVVLRTKPLKNGNKSIYLDIYDGGKRRYEFLRLYLVPEVNDNAKRINESALKKANEIKSKFVLGIDRLDQKKNESSITMQEWLNEYCRRMENEREVSAATKGQTLAVKAIVEEYLASIKKKNIKLSKFGKTELRDFLIFLRNYKGERVDHFSANTLVTYQQRIVAILNAALHDGLIERNPIELIEDEEKFEQPRSNKGGLTVDEVMKIASTKHSNNQVRLGFLFACFTGLRLGDVRTLKWSEIIDMGTYKAIIKEQGKTKKQMAVPLCNTALMFLPEQQDDEFVFHLPQYTWLNNSLQRIVKAAGIQKSVSFHTSRHTFATLTHSVCKNIKVVSNLLGHRSVETTQRYAGVIDEKRTEVVNKLGSALG